MNYIFPFWTSPVYFYWIAQYHDVFSDTDLLTPMCAIIYTRSCCQLNLPLCRINLASLVIQYQKKKLHGKFGKEAYITHCRELEWKTKNG